MAVRLLPLRRPACPIVAALPTAPRTAFVPSTPGGLASVPTSWLAGRRAGERVMPLPADARNEAVDRDASRARASDRWKWLVPFALALLGSVTGVLLFTMLQPSAEPVAD